MRTHREAWGRRVRLLALLAAGLAVVAPASAARLVAVRVGHHPDFTRVVVQLDERASYRIEGPLADAPPELRLTVAAESDPVQLVPPRWTRFVRSIRVEPGAGTAQVRVVLDRADVRIAEQVLERPPRIVVDVGRAAEAAPTPPEREPPRPSPEPPPEPEAVPFAAAPPAPKPLAAPAPAPAPVEGPEPAPPALEPEAMRTEPPVSTAPPSSSPLRILLLVLGAIAILAGAWIALVRRGRARVEAASTIETAPPWPRPAPVPHERAAAMPTAPAPVEDETQALRTALQAIERRLAGIEARLDDVLDWRERSARALDAQTEELRVQRATLSRVRRVVRSMARPEDLLGEPRPR